jgi:hypothetical protein
MVLPLIGSDSFPRTKRFDARDRLALVHNAKRRTTGVRPLPAVPFRPGAESSDGGTIFGIPDRGIGTTVHRAPLTPLRAPALHS